MQNSAVVNFRDIGGITNQNDKIVRKNVFFRSGQLSDLSQNESQAFCSKYNLQIVTDLRSAQEIKNDPEYVGKNTQYLHIDILKNMKVHGASLKDFDRLESAQSAKNYMVELYKNIATDPCAHEGYHTFFEAILSLEKNKGFLFHCFAGKDRTGIGAMLILEALNVSKEKIYADYLKTNTMRKAANDEFLAELRAKDSSKNEIEAMEVALTVEKQYLDAFYKTVEEGYGNMQNYLRQAIGLTNEQIDIMQKRFLLSNNK